MDSVFPASNETKDNTKNTNDNAENKISSDEKLFATSIIPSGIVEIPISSRNFIIIFLSKIKTDIA